MSAFQKLARHSAILITVVSLAACGGGGGGGSTPTAPSASFSLDKTSLTFAAPSPDALYVTEQTVTGTVTGNISGTLYVIATVTGTAVQGVSTFTISANTGRGSVSVRPPYTLAVGTYSSSISVRACVNDSTCSTGQLAGSPQVINVSYSVGTPVVADAVWPHVLAAGTTGQVIIRGGSLSSVSTVAFGSTPATAFSLVSDSEIHATYPASLTAGSVPIRLNGGATAFSGSIVVVSPTSFVTQALTYPETPNTILKILFDGERNALFVAAGMAQPANSKLWRYGYSGGAWTSPSVVVVPNLRDIALSANGSRLLALTDGSILELDAANVGAGTLATHSLPDPLFGTFNNVLYTFAPTNDGNTLVTTIPARGASGFSNPAVYSSSAGTITDLPTLNKTMYQGVVIASADGSKAFFVQAGISPYQQIIQYSSSTQHLTSAPVTAATYLAKPVSVDASARVIAVHNMTYDGATGQFALNHLVYDASFNLLGTLPRSVIAIVSPAGTRAHVLGFDGMLSSFDLTLPPVTGSFPQLGASLPLTTAAFANTARSSAITPDGAAVFFAGTSGIQIAAVPP